MVIHGIQKLTLLDYPGHTACTVFTGHCNFRCPFCHNASLVLRPEEQPVLPDDELWNLLSRRHGLLDGVAVTGGEPTLNPDLPVVLERIHAEGFLVKLDTNGTNAAMLEDILSRGLADYVAMDIKSSPERYPAVTGVKNSLFGQVARSVELLKSANVPYEFRTTVVKPLHRIEDFPAIGEWLKGEEPYFLQAYKDSGDVVDAVGLSAFSRDEMEEFRNLLLPYLPRTEIRGMD